MSDVVVLMNGNGFEKSMAQNEANIPNPKRDITAKEVNVLAFRMNGFSMCDQKANAAMHNNPDEFNEMMADNLVMPYMKNQNINLASLPPGLATYVTDYEDRIEEATVEDNVPTVDAEFEVIDNTPQQPKHQSGIKLLPPGKR